MHVWTRLMHRVDFLVESVLSWDERAMIAVSENPVMRRFNHVLVTATYLGDGYLWGVMALVLILFGATADRFNVLTGLGVSVVNITIFRFIKLLFSRQRPEGLGSGLRSRIMDSYSFPSGHATTSFGLAWVVSQSYPILPVQIAIYAVAGMISISRIYVREHYPLDVLAGAILGTVVASYVYPFFRWLFF